LSKWATPLQGNLSSKIGLRHKSDKLLVDEDVFDCRARSADGTGEAKMQSAAEPG
jgi:hypothetical protein